MIFSKRSHEGYLMVDHRASPGIPADKARCMGLNPDQVKEGKIFEGATLGCPHCGSAVVLNPLRTRARGHCFQCNQYICDWCDAARSHPDYVHRTARQIAELVTSGKFILSGSMSRPILTASEN